MSASGQDPAISSYEAPQCGIPPSTNGLELVLESRMKSIEFSLISASPRQVPGLTYKDRFAGRAGSGMNLKRAVGWPIGT